MSDKDGVMSVKDEQKHSPSYRRASLYGEDVYTPKAHLSTEHLYNDDLRHAQQAVSRHYQWNDAGDPVMDSGRGK